MATVKDYSVEEKLTALVKLQKIDSKLDQIQILKGELPMEVSDLEDEIAGLTSRKNRVEEEINGISDFIEQKKNAIKESEALVKKYEKQSEAVKNNREFEAINKEIEMQQLEERFFDALDSLIEDRKDTLQHFKQRVKNLHPTTILKKGFAIIKSNNKIITDPKDIKVKSELQTILKNEIIYSTVNKKSKNEK